ncbi:MAG: membrane protein insertase YidC [Candidatus Adiutrix sp.]|jgi:YidC/Oxa1 family membrane protein insertase|nr:membrane protein insertase YidC [Candidatus Adiutrix sp.]
MDKRSFWIMTLVMVVILGWGYIAPAPETTSAPTAAPSAAVPAVSGSPAAAPPATTSPMAKPATRQVTVTTPHYVAVFDERGGRLASFTLTDYHRRKLGADLSAARMELINQTNPADWPLLLRLTSPSAPPLEEAPFLAEAESLKVAEGQTGHLTMTFQDQSGLQVSRTYAFSGDTFLVGQRVSLDNGGQHSLDGAVTMRINTAPFSPANPSQYAGLGAYVNNSLLTEPAADAGAALAKLRGKLVQADWVGYMDQYFLTALVLPDRSETPGDSLPELAAVLQDHGGLAVAASRTLNLIPGQKAAFDFDFYYGPKNSRDLKAAGHNLAKSVDLGWFSFLAIPLASLLHFLYSLVGNYGLAIIIVTILIKIVLWPLTAASYRSMKEMQKLTPKVAKLREKYADDKEAMNREIMSLYKTYKVNPLGGCLPMLLQIPFFIAFYRVLYSLLELRGAPFIFWIQDLSAPDRLGALDFTIPFYEPPTGLPVLTILMGISMVVQQKMTPTTMGDPTQAKIMMMMPVFFTIILINMPAGLVLYWLVNNILSIVQQKLINRPAKPGAGAAGAR